MAGAGPAALRQPFLPSHSRVKSSGRRTPPRTGRSRMSRYSNSRHSAQRSPVASSHSHRTPHRGPLPPLSPDVRRASAPPKPYKDLLQAEMDRVFPYLSLTASKVKPNVHDRQQRLSPSLTQPTIVGYAGHVPGFRDTFAIDFQTSVDKGRSDIMTMTHSMPRATTTVPQPVVPRTAHRPPVPRTAVPSSHDRRSTRPSTNVLEARVRTALRGLTPAQGRAITQELWATHSIHLPHSVQSPLIATY